MMTLLTAIAHAIAHSPHSPSPLPVQLTRQPIKIDVSNFTPDSWDVAGVIIAALGVAITGITSIFTLLNTLAIKRLQEVSNIPGNPLLFPIEHTEKSVVLENRGQRPALVDRIIVIGNGWWSRLKPFYSRQLPFTLVEPSKSVTIEFQVPVGDFNGEVRVYYAEADRSRIPGKSRPYWVKFYRAL
jgi:hypothetical protein